MLGRYITKVYVDEFPCWKPRVCAIISWTKRKSCQYLLKVISDHSETNTECWCWKKVISARSGPIIPALSADVKCQSVKKPNCLVQLSLCNAFLMRFEPCVCFLKDFTNALAMKKQQSEI